MVSILHDNGMVAFAFYIEILDKQYMLYLWSFLA